MWRGYLINLSSNKPKREEIYFPLNETVLEVKEMISERFQIPVEDPVGFQLETELEFQRIVIWTTLVSKKHGGNFFAHNFLINILAYV